MWLHKDGWIISDCRITHPTIYSSNPPECEKEMSPVAFEELLTPLIRSQQPTVSNQASSMDDCDRPAHISMASPEPDKATASQPRAEIFLARLLLLANV
nr:hypothetical protein CFP56_16221 [Quercus suber]